MVEAYLQFYSNMEFTEQPSSGNSDSKRSVNVAVVYVRIWNTLECCLYPFPVPFGGFMRPGAVWTEISAGSMEKHAPGEDVDLNHTNHDIRAHDHFYHRCVAEASCFDSRGGC